MISYILVHFGVLKYHFHINYQLSIIDTVANGVCIFLLLQLIKTLKKRNAEGIPQIILLIGQNLLFSFIYIYIIDITIEYYFKNQVSYIEFYKDSISFRIIISWILLCNLTIVQFIAEENDKKKEIQERTIYNEQLKKDAELFKLRQQINPHFLFNTLNSINALITISPEKARNMIQQLSQYFRNSIKKEDHSLLTVAEEMSDIDLYFEIEKVRFGHRLAFEEKINDQALSYHVPPFLLQPLVENAIKHGLYGTIGKIVIRLQLELTDINGQKFISFQITNPFDTEVKQTSGTGFGISSIERRLYLLYARNDLFKVNIEPIENEATLKTFIATLLIPIEESTINE